MTDKAIELIEYGIKNNPDDWHLYEDLGFVYYLNLKDYPKASEAFLRGSKRPNAHPFLKVLAAQAAQHGGEMETARMLWSAIYQTSRDKYILVNAEAHLRAIQADMDVTALEQVVETFRQRTGRFPASFAEMDTAGLMRGIPQDPLGNPYKLSSDGHVLLSKPDDLPFVAKGLPAGYVAPRIPKIPPAD
jgi:tetratricopeptide (TPR) repeat protein